MHRYSVLMTLCLLTMLLLGLQLPALLGAIATIKAEVNIHPEVLNLKRNGTRPHGVITALISNLTKEGISYDVKNVNTSTITLYHETAFVAQPLRVKIARNHLIAKFDATTVANYVWAKLYHMGVAPPSPPPDYTLTFTIRGELFSGEEFAGTDEMKIILP